MYWELELKPQVQLQIRQQSAKGFYQVQIAVDRKGKRILLLTKVSKAAVPNLFGTRDWFRGRQFFHGLGRRMVSE